MIAIFYHYHFRNKKSIEVSMDWLKSPYPSQACRSKGLQQAGTDMLDGRKPFCKLPCACLHENMIGTS